MNYSFEDALLEDEELEQYQDFIYNITDGSSFKGRNNATDSKEQVIKKEDIDIQKGVIASPQNAFNWITKEKNEFIARMKATGRNKPTN